MTMQRTLSSAWTLFEKFMVPGFWVIASGMLRFIVAGGRFHNQSGTPPPVWMMSSILGVWLLVSGFIYWYCIRLKRVRIDEEALYISNYLKEVRVPLRDVAEVSENRWVNIHPVTIEFRSDTEFGRRIVFMPKIRLFGWSSHPVVAELREAARRAASV